MLTRLRVMTALSCLPLALALAACGERGDGAPAETAARPVRTIIVGGSAGSELRRFPGRVEATQTIYEKGAADSFVSGNAHEQTHDDKAAHDEQQA